MYPSDELTKNLRRRSIQAGAAVIGGQITVTALNLAATMFLARLLTPMDFGLVAMVTVVLGFAITLRDLGLTAATVQRQTLSMDEVNSLFWVNAGMGALLTITVFLIAPAVALLYNEPQLVPIAQALAFLSLIDGLAIQHQALIRRQLRLGVLTGIDIAATVAGLGGAIFFAYNGLGYWSLVWMYLIQMAVRAVLSWLVTGWRPSFRFQTTNVRSLLSFGGSITCARLLSNFTKLVDKFLIGRFGSAEQLGVYSKSYNAALLPSDRINMALSRVAIPTLSRLQDDPNRFRKYYKKALMLVTVSILPAFTGLFLEARSAITIVLGDQWLFAVPLIQILSPVAAITVITMTVRWIFISLGHRGRLVKWQVFDSVGKILGIVIGINWGAMGVAYGLLVSSSAIMLPSFWYGFRDTSIRITDVLSVIWKPILASIVAASSIVVTRSLALPDTNIVVVFALESVLFACAYLAVWLILPKGRVTLLEVIALAQEFRRGSPNRELAK